MCLIWNNTSKSSVHQHNSVFFYPPLSSRLRVSPAEGQGKQSLRKLNKCTSAGISKLNRCFICIISRLLVFSRNFSRSTKEIHSFCAHLIEILKLCLQISHAQEKNTVVFFSLNRNFRTFNCRWKYFRSDNQN